MLDFCLLGTGGMTPMPNRWLTSLMVRCSGSDILVDCGEGTQIAMKEAGWSPKSIDIICFTHFHADHIAGLPGMLLNIANADRTEPLIMVGPKGLFNVTKSLRCIAPDLPYELRFVELDQETEQYRIGTYTVSCFRVKHNLPCYGYSFYVPRNGRFNPERAMELEIPMEYWNRLQKGETVEDKKRKRIFTPDMVLGPERKGLKLTYSTDTRPCENLRAAASGSDVLIAEGIYGEEGSEEKARAYKHMTMREAAQLAASCDELPGELIFTHYSPSMLHPKQYLDEIRKIFPNAVCGKDGMVRELSFTED